MMTVVREITDADRVIAGVTGICAGANVRTPCGARRIEFVRKGDLIVTRDNGLQPVRLVWTRTVTAAEIAADPSLSPVHIGSRAVGPMMPQRGFSVGAAHRLLIPGWRLLDEEDTESCLVPARDVTELSEVDAQERAPESVIYYNIVFETAEVFAVNGLPVESFAPTEEALRTAPGDARSALRRAFPELGPRFADYPAPRYKLRERVSYTPDFA